MIDGEYWTYCSVKAFEELFPYMSKKTIRTSLQKLEDSGVIKCGYFNSKPYDRTKWYALTEKGYSICQKGKIDLPKGENRIAEKEQPIPNINTNIITDIESSKEDYKGDSEEPPSIKANVYPKLVAEWNTLSACGIQTIRGITQESQRHKLLRTRLKEYGEDSFYEVVEKIRESDFLQGRTAGRTPFVATFDWVIKPSNYPKVLEGNYDNRNQRHTDKLSQKFEEMKNW